MHPSSLPEGALDTGRDVLDALGLGLYRIDGQGLCTYANPAALKMLGYEAHEVLGRNMHELIHHSHPDGTPYPQSTCPLMATTLTGRSVRLSNEVLWRKDGSFFTAEYSAWPMSAGDPSLGSVVTLVDTAWQGSASDRLALQVTVSRMLTGTAEIEDVLPRLLEAVGSTLGFEVGFFWTVNHRERQLEPEASWTAPGLDADTLVQATMALTLDRGTGLPGRAWEEAEIVTEAELRSQAARAAGLVSSLAIPARVGRRVLGVIELYARTPLDAGDDLLDSAAAIGQQVGQSLRRRRAEAALRDREEEFRALAEKLPQLTWIADATGAINWFNRRWYDYTGASFGQVEGWGWLDLQHPDHLARVEESYRAAIEAGTVWEETFPMRGQDGRYRWFLSRALPIPDNEGRLTRWFATSTDITAQRQAEGRALAAERRLRFALQVARISSWTWDFERDEIEADEGFRTLFELPAGEDALPAAAFLTRIHPDDADRVADAIKRAKDDLGEFDLEFRLGDSDGDSPGQVRWTVMRGTVERRPFGRGLYALGITWDVTEPKRREEDLASAKMAAEDANRAKSQFIANMSHELRTPLSAIIGYAELLEEETEDLGEAVGAMAEDLGKIESSARHLLSLINGVLDLSKIEAGKMEVEVQPFDAAPLVQEVCDTVEGLMAKKDNGFTVAIAPDLGLMRSDPVKLRQCLFNLLSNAAKFTEGGMVTLRAARDGTQLIFEVADTGIGITPEQQARLFQRFTQADVSTTRRFGGTGLGLALTRAFSEMLGGTISVASVEGEGTTFTLTLPDDIDAAADAGATSGADAEAGAADRVLVIDDDPNMRDLLMRFLGRDGLSVASAANGEDGLALAREIAPSAIILDVMMPRMDGWAVLSALKADPDLAEIPVIMVSMIRETGLAYSLGAADYLTKPVDWQRLKASVDRHRTHTASAAGLALVVEGDAASRDELGRLLTGEGWRVREAGDASEAGARIGEERPDLILINLDLPEVDGFTLLGELRRNPERRTIPVIALTEGSLSLDERMRLRDQVRQVIQPGEDSVDELLDELKRIAALRMAAKKEGRG